MQQKFISLSCKDLCGPRQISRVVVLCMVTELSRLFQFFGPSISTYSLLHDCLSGARKSLESHTWAFHCLSLEMMCTITLAITTSHVALSNCKEYKN